MKYAIVESGGKQYKAVEGSTIEVDLLQTEPGTSLKLEAVLMVVNGDDVDRGVRAIHQQFDLDRV